MQHDCDEKKASEKDDKTVINDPVYLPIERWKNKIATDRSKYFLHRNVILLYLQYFNVP